MVVAVCLLGNPLDIDEKWNVNKRQLTLYLPQPEKKRTEPQGQIMLRWGWIFAWALFNEQRVCHMFFFLNFKRKQNCNSENFLFSRNQTCTSILLFLFFSYFLFRFLFCSFEENLVKFVVSFLFYFSNVYFCFCICFLISISCKMWLDVFVILFLLILFWEEFSNNAWFNITNFHLTLKKKNQTNCTFFWIQNKSSSKIKKWSQIVK